MRAAARRTASLHRFDARYRTVPERQVVDCLLLGGFAYAPEPAAAAELVQDALSRWVVSGLGYEGGRAGERFFDPVEVVHFFKIAATTGLDAFFDDHYIPTGRRLVDELKSQPGQVYAADIDRTFDVGEMGIGEPLRLRLPLPLTDVHQVLDVDPSADGLVEPRFQVSDGRLQVRGRANGPLVRLRAKVRFAGAHLDSGEPDAARMLKPREGLIAATPRIKDLAAALPDPGGGAAEAVRAYWLYIAEELNCGPIHYDQVDLDAPCDWVLDAGWCDCQLAASLFIALCRSRGLPARLVSGHFLYARAPTNHFWAEVWFEGQGWRPFDFFGWELSGSAKDSAWRDRFYGRLDPRMVTQRLPTQFTGAPGVAIPTAWHLLQKAKGDGVEIRMTDLSGRLIYSDAVAVRPA